MDKQEAIGVIKHLIKEYLPIDYGYPNKKREEVVSQYIDFVAMEIYKLFPTPNRREG